MVVGALLLLLLVVLDTAIPPVADDGPVPVDVDAEDDDPPVCLGLNAIVVLDFLLLEGLDHPPFSMN